MEYGFNYYYYLKKCHHFCNNVSLEMQGVLNLLFSIHQRDLECFTSKLIFNSFLPLVAVNATLSESNELLLIHKIFSLFAFSIKNTLPKKKRHNGNVGKTNNSWTRSEYRQKLLIAQIEEDEKKSRKLFSAWQSGSIEIKFSHELRSVESP